MEYVIEVGDELAAKDAVKLVRGNRILLWRGDFRNALQLLAAMKRRLRRVPRGSSPADTFRKYRQATTERSKLLSRVQVELGPGYTLARTTCRRVRAREPCQTRSFRRDDRAPA